MVEFSFLISKTACESVLPSLAGVVALEFALLLTMLIRLLFRLAVLALT